MSLSSVHRPFGCIQKTLGYFFFFCYNSNYRVLTHSLHLLHSSAQHSQWTEPQRMKLFLMKLFCLNSIVTGISYVCVCVFVFLKIKKKIISNTRLSFSPECSFLLFTSSLKSQTSILPSSNLKRFASTANACVTKPLNTWPVCSAPSFSFQTRSTMVTRGVLYTTHDR